MSNPFFRVNFPLPIDFSREEFLEIVNKHPYFNRYSLNTPYENNGSISFNLLLDDHLDFFNLKNIVFESKQYSNIDRNPFMMFDRHRYNYYSPIIQPDEKRPVFCMSFNLNRDLKLISIEQNHMSIWGCHLKEIISTMNPNKTTDAILKYLEIVDSKIDSFLMNIDQNIHDDFVEVSDDGDDILSVSEIKTSEFFDSNNFTPDFFSVDVSDNDAAIIVFDKKENRTSILNFHSMNSPYSFNLLLSKYKDNPDDISVSVLGKKRMKEQVATQLFGIKSIAPFVKFEFIPENETFFINPKNGKITPSNLMHSKNLKYIEDTKATPRPNLEYHFNGKTIKIPDDYTGLDKFNPSFKSIEEPDPEFYMPNIFKP